MRRAGGALLALACFAGAAQAQQVDDSALEELQADVARSGIRVPVTFDKRVAAGRSYLRKSRYLEAAQEFYEAATLEPGHPLPNLLFAHAMLGMRSWREAKDVLRKGLRMYPKWRRLGYPAGQDFPDAGEWRDVVRTLEQRRSREPKGAPARLEFSFLLGYCYLANGERSKAKIAFTEAADGPGALAEARAYLEELQRPPRPKPAPGQPAPPIIDPHHRPPAKPAAPAPATPAPAPPAGDSASPFVEPDPFRRGNALVLEGRYGEAAEAFLESVIDDPAGMNGILAHFELSHALFAVGRWSQSVTALRRGLRRYPDWGRVKLNRRDWYPAARPGDFETHLRKLESAAGADPGNVRLQFLLGYTAYFVGRRSQARQAFEAVVAQRADADAARFLELIAEAERLIPDGGEATPPQDAPPAATPEQPKPPAPRTNAVIGAERFAVRDYAAAWAAYKAAVRQHPQDGALQLAASRAAFAARDWTAAVAALRAGLRLHPTTEWPGITGKWRNAFPSGDDYTRRLDELNKRVEQLEFATDLDLRFLAGFTSLSAARLSEAVNHFRRLKHMDLDPAKPDAEARFFIDRLNVK